MNFTTQSRHVSLLVTFALKLTFSGLTAEKKEDQLRIDIKETLNLYTVIVFTTRHSNVLIYDGVPLHYRHS